MRDQGIEEEETEQKLIKGKDMMKEIFGKLEYRVVEDLQITLQELLVESFVKDFPVVYVGLPVIKE